MLTVLFLFQGSSFDTKFSLPSFIRRVEKLTEEQRAAIIKSGFGNLLKIHNQMISKVLLGELMERWDSEKMTFKLLHGEVTITAKDVALILGLRVIGKSVALDRPFSDLEKKYGATPSNRKISISIIEERLESIGGEANEDFVRSFLLYTFGSFLFPNSSGKVDSVYLTLLEDLDKVSEYAWGEAVRQDLFSWITRRKEESVRWVGGCLLLLQGGQICSVQDNFLGPVVGKITWVLHPTTSESEIDVVKQFLEAESPKEEVPVGQSSDSRSGAIECAKSVACQPKSKEAVASQCAPNIDLSKNLHMKQESVLEASETVSDITQCYPETKETIPSQYAAHKDLGKSMHFRQVVFQASDVASDIIQSCSETIETAESLYTRNPDSEQGIQMAEDLISEASGASLDIPLEVSESPEISNYTRDCDNDDRLPIISQRLAALQIQELKELKKENAILKDQVLMIPQLKKENTELKAELEDLKRHNQHVDSTFVDLDKMLSLYFNSNDSNYGRQD
ncbi:hypothetical protein V2J09_012196 [Rumex salicifolius]